MLVLLVVCYINSDYDSVSLYIYLYNYFYLKILFFFCSIGEKPKLYFHLKPNHNGVHSLSFVCLKFGSCFFFLFFFSSFLVLFNPNGEKNFCRILFHFYFSPIYLAGLVFFFLHPGSNLTNPLIFTFSFI